MKATDLSVGDIGKTFRSITYPNNNKTAKPNAWGRRVDANGYERYARTATVWTLETLYAHANGNIKINNHFHLRPDTEIERVETD